MNLHKITSPLSRVVALWLDLYGARGRIGRHVWTLERDFPPALAETPLLPGRERQYFRPRRYYNWTPFERPINNLFSHGYIQPLCGYQTRARNPRAYTIPYQNAVDPHAGATPRLDHNMCIECYHTLIERGIIAYTATDFIASNYEIMRTLDTERNEWIQAGRPDEWPPLI